MTRITRNDHTTSSDSTDQTLPSTGARRRDLKKTRTNKRLPTGWAIKHPETFKKMRSLAENSLLKMIAPAICYWGLIGVAVSTTMFIWSMNLIILSALLYVFAVIFIARTMRAFECLTHEFGHGVWPNERQSWDDVFGNLIAALPMGLTVASMRKSHNHPHHDGLADDRVDPDRKRSNSLDADMLDRSRWLLFLTQVLRRMPKYWFGWFQALGVNLYTLFASILWHAALMLAISVLSGHFIGSFMIWIAFWLVPYVCVLPFIRFIGETAEHVYLAGSSVIDVTVSNIGPIHWMLIHPLGDGYHSLHHRFPQVPGRNLARLHKWMIENEPEYRAKLKYRVKILENPHSH